MRQFGSIAWNSSWVWPPGRPPRKQCTVSCDTITWSRKPQSTSFFRFFIRTSSGRIIVRPKRSKPT